MSSEKENRLDLNEQNVQQVFAYCLANNHTKPEDILEVSYIKNPGVVPNMKFDKKRIMEKNNDIAALVLQLENIDKNIDMKAMDGFKKYNGTIWTNNKIALFALYYLGVAGSVLPQLIYSQNLKDYLAPIKEFNEGVMLKRILYSCDTEIVKRKPVREFMKFTNLNDSFTLFDNFILFYAKLFHGFSNNNICFSIMVVYEDMTYDLDVFKKNVLTESFDEKVNEIAERIPKDNIKEIYVMRWTFNLNDINKNILEFVKLTTEMGVEKCMLVEDDMRSGEALMNAIIKKREFELIDWGTLRDIMGISPMMMAIMENCESK